MEIIYIVQAIKKLRPNAEFSFRGEDYSEINWIVLEGNPPTYKEITDAIKLVKKEEIADNEAKVQAKAALLDRLGITADEAKLLLS